jgi:hypothetical protein
VEMDYRNPFSYDLEEEGDHHRSLVLGQVPSPDPFLDPSPFPYSVVVVVLGEAAIVAVGHLEDKTHWGEVYHQDLVPAAVCSCHSHWVEVALFLDLAGLYTGLEEAGPPSADVVVVEDRY